MRASVRFGLVVAVAAGLPGCAEDGAAVAAAASPTPPAIVRTEVARATLLDGGPARFAPGTDTVLVEVTLPPGSSTGWHAHPNGGVFMVDGGTVASYGLDGPLCKPTAIAAGRSLFVPPHAGHPHLVRNESAEPAHLRAFYFGVPAGQPSAAKTAAPAECPVDLR